MKQDYGDFELDDWGGSEDEVLFESEEFADEFDDEPEVEDAFIADELPVLPLRGVVVYPMMWLPLPIGQERSLRLVEDNLPANRIIALVTGHDEDVEEPSPEQVHAIGTAAQVHRVLRTPDGTIRLLVQGLERIRITEYTQEEPYLRARVEALPETIEEGIEMDALVRTVEKLFRQLIELEPQLPEELAMMAINAEDPRQLAYLTASSIRLKTEDAQSLLELDSVHDKLLSLTQMLNKEVEVLELGRKIQSEAQGEMERMQRDFFLREQMKAIQKELGEDDEQTADIRELETRIDEAGMSEEAEKEARRELDRMRRMPIQAAEYSVIKTYLDLMVSLPWQTITEDNLDIDHARQVLDEDHYGLDEIKERILEFLAVRKLRADRKDDGGRRRSARQNPPRARRRGALLCRPAGRRQDKSGHQHRPGHGPQVCAPCAGRRARRSRYSRLSPHLHWLYAGPHHPKPTPGGEQKPGLYARRSRQAEPRLSGRSLQRAAGSAGSRSRIGNSAITIWTYRSISAR